MLANGTVEVNTRSPAYYLNQSFYGNVTVPPIGIAERAAALDGRRPHGAVRMARSPHPLDVAGAAAAGQGQGSKRTLIFNWQVPIAVGASKGNVDGQLFWTPESSTAPVAAIVIGVRDRRCSAVLFVLVMRDAGGRARTEERGRGRPGSAARGGVSRRQLTVRRGSFSWR